MGNLLKLSLCLFISILSDPVISLGYISFIVLGWLRNLFPEFMSQCSLNDYIFFPCHYLLIQKNRKFGPYFMHQ